MNLHVEKDQSQKNNAVSNQKKSLQLKKGQKDFSIKTVHQQMVDDSEHVKQLHTFQQIANRANTINPTQFKAESIQKMGEEEEMVKAKSSSIQKMGEDEEELIQAKFAPIQKIGKEEEEMQLKAMPLQKKENHTGLPNQLKSGIENLSGYALDDVKVHYNSAQPAQLQAHAYAQGTDIHIAPGQEKHLPHEAWHVVQQKQGRVQPNLQMKGGVNVNDDAGLENEADVMGAKANIYHQEIIQQKKIESNKLNNYVIQRVVYPNIGAMWAAVHPGYALANIAQDSELSSLYNDAVAQLPNVDFNVVGNQSPQITSTPLALQPFRLDYDLNANLGLDNDYYAGAIIHELAHAASSQQYRRQGVNQNLMVFANLNLPAPVGIVNPATGMTPNQMLSYQNQMQTLDDNWQDLDALAQQDGNSGIIGINDYNHIDGRIQYALATAFAHNETVLGDIMYYLLAKNLDDSNTYKFASRMLKESNDRRQNGFWSNADTEVRRVDSRAWWFQFWKW